MSVESSITAIFYLADTQKIKPYRPALISQ